MTELKPCPFCGSSNRIEIGNIRNGDEFYVYCRTCGASTSERRFK